MSARDIERHTPMVVYIELMSVDPNTAVVAMNIMLNRNKLSMILGLNILDIFSFIKSLRVTFLSGSGLYMVTLSVLKGSSKNWNRMMAPVVRKMVYATTGVFVVMLRAMNTILKRSLVPNQKPNGYRNAPWKTSRK